MYQRHTNLFISSQGRERILNNALAQGMRERDCRTLLLPEWYAPEVLRDTKYRYCDSIPGIVRREEGETPTGFIPVGFSSWKKADGQKIRLAAFVTPDEIVATATPWDVLAQMRGDTTKAQRTGVLSALAEFVQNEDESVFSLGVWGSVAMELLTGYFYTRADSDLDIILKVTGKPEDEKKIDATLSDWLEVVKRIESKFDLRIDAELSLSNGYGVSLKELFRSGQTVLAKGQTDVVLLSKSKIFDEFVVGRPMERNTQIFQIY